MDRIEAAFARGREENRALFIAYVCAGDPNLETSLSVCRTLIERGTDILELGVPFSDPLADGLTNQLAAERALKNGMNQEKVFQLIERIRAFSEVPIVLYTYYNLVFSNGLGAYAARAAKAGVDGVLTLDLPPEEGAEFESAARREGLKNIYIIAPTTPDDRIALITGRASGFIYYVSQEGVTGERKEVAANLESRLAAIRAHTEVPIVVGFGISRPEHVKAVARLADGVVVGSALVNCIAAHPEDPDRILADLSAKMDPFVPELGKE
jgi:tryptophan synthase alpha chain